MRLIVILLCALTVPMIAGCDRQKADAPQAPAADSQEAKGLDRSHKGEPAPTVKFKNPDGGFSYMARRGGGGQRGAQLSVLALYHGADARRHRPVGERLAERLCRLR